VGQFFYAYFSVDQSFKVNNNSNLFGFLYTSYYLCDIIKHKQMTQEQLKTKIQKAKQDMYAAHAFGDKKAAKKHWLQMITLEKDLDETKARVKEEMKTLYK
jgi:hypothetical protein